MRSFKPLDRGIGRFFLSLQEGKPKTKNRGNTYDFVGYWIPLDAAAAATAKLLMKITFPLAATRLAFQCHCPCATASLSFYYTHCYICHAAAVNVAVVPFLIGFACRQRVKKKWIGATTAARCSLMRPIWFNNKKRKKKHSHTHKPND